MVINGNKIIPVFIEEEMRNSYIDYSMSVIVARALPDVRDGLKPVHRRVLYGMMELGLRPNSPYKKSARIVGEVLGKYHPHGDSAVYDTMVRMVQPFSLRYPLVDGQGNFGSVDGDSPAAMRYTEARLAPIAEEVLKDIEKETVPFVANFDETLKEPSVLPSLLPTLLINGASGIAVGMATNIPPHNLNEVIDACAALIDKPGIRLRDLVTHLHGADFPTGGIIINKEEIYSYFKSGRGKLILRAKAHIEDIRGGRQRLIITEIPYQVNKSSLIERTASMVRNKKIEGITEIRDESDREGMRIVMELRKGVNTNNLLNSLYKHTQMQTTFGVILLALVDGQPRILNIKEMLAEFIKHRHTVVLRRLKFDLEKAQARAHILEGLKIALDNIDEIIATIKKSRTIETARTNLEKKFKLSKIQAQAILDMRLQKLTGLERKKIEEEYLQLIKLIQKLKSLLSSKKLRMQLIKDELLALKEKYGDLRKTRIFEKKSKAKQQMISEEKVVITLTHKWVGRRFTEMEYKASSDSLKRSDQNDFVKYAFTSSNSNYILFFDERGKCYTVRSSFIPLASTSNGGISIQKVLNIKDKIVGYIEIPAFDDKHFIFLATRNGLVKRSRLDQFNRKSDGGLTAIQIKSGDKLSAAFLTSGENEVLLASTNGKAIRFSEQDIRDMGLTAGGIRGMNVDKDDFIVNAFAIKHTKSEIFSVTRIGYGKRSDLAEYSLIGRGGKGILNYKVSPRVGHVVDVIETTDKSRCIIITKKGRQKRVKIKDTKIMSRASQGLPVASIAKGDEVIEIVKRPAVSL
jgi:DNA gyrase subunit A